MIYWDEEMGRPRDEDTGRFASVENYLNQLAGEYDEDDYAGLFEEEEEMILDEIREEWEDEFFDAGDEFEWTADLYPEEA
jgi:hypothetical protein